MRPSDKLSIFVSAPSDVALEREKCERILAQYKKRMSLLNKVEVDYFMWPTSVVPNVGSYAQAVISEQTKNADGPAYDHDIVICLLWTRAGTPTRYLLSGTTEELVYSLMSSYRRHKYVMLYVSDIPIAPSKIELHQLANIRILKRCLERFGGISETYHSIKKFDDSLREHLDKASSDILAHRGEPTSQTEQTGKSDRDVLLEYPEYMHLVTQGLDELSAQLQHNTRACLEIMRECGAHFQHYLSQEANPKAVEAWRTDLQHFCDKVERRFSVRPVAGEKELLHKTKVLLAFLPCLLNKEDIVLGQHLIKCAQSFVSEFKHYDAALRKLSVLLEGSWPRTIYAFGHNSVLGQLANEANQLGKARSYARGIADLLGERTRKTYA